MHPLLLARSLAAIQPKITLLEFQALSGISSRSVAKSVLCFLQANGIGNSISGTYITFSSSDRLRVATLALKMGCDTELVASQLSWKDFEKLTSEILMSFGYHTQTNLRLIKPRMEIDVVGISSDFAIVVDCKHWKKNNLASISAFSQKQAERTKRLVMKDKRITQAVPAIVTLYNESVKFINKIPIVPISRFESFVRDVKDFLYETYTVENINNNRDINSTKLV
jgi:hypothetical protein